MGSTQKRLSMGKYKYELAKNKKIKCPDCGQKTYVPYCYNGTKDILNDMVGKCDRSANCGRHYTPGQYHADNPENSPITPVIEPKVYTPPKPLQYFPDELLVKSLTNYENNSFVTWLNMLFPAQVVKNAIEAYKVGTSASRWQGGCVFWFVAAAGKVKAGQVKKFNSEGHTDSYYSQKAGKDKKCTEWVHTILKYKHERANQPQPEWLKAYIERGDYCTTLYGEHLLNLPENKHKPVALCEAPKTAIVASIYLPQYVWLATGALDYFTEERIKVLQGRDVFLFPDLSISQNEPGKPYGKVFYRWQNRGLCYSHIANFKTSDILENKATEQDRAHGLDLCDYLISIPYQRALADEFKAGMLKPGVNESEQMKLLNDMLRRGADSVELKKVIDELVQSHGFEIAA